MLLVDTSVWVDHLRNENNKLQYDLLQNKVLTHPHIIGEISLGSLKNRRLVLSLLKELPFAAVAQDSEVQEMIERQKLYGKVIGYVDAHLLAATLITPGTQLWTKDKRLHEMALELDVAI
ncbi:MAG: type II toxin-antitoxin system VapC family toxin [Pseudomonadota bacterium]